MKKAHARILYKDLGRATNNNEKSIGAAINSIMVVFNI
jgi:hypothetical protein